MLRPSRTAIALCVVLGLCAGLRSTEAAAAEAGAAMFTANLSTNSVTGEKPQSKLFFHDGSWWAILRGPSGVAFYEKMGSGWYRCVFMDAVLTSSGEADVKWDGLQLHVLVYSSVSKYFEYTYDGALRVWNLTPGFPVNVPNPSGCETMVLESDSAGRLWTTAEGGGKVNVYYTTSADHRTWSSSPIVLRSGLSSDDITSIIAFGGNNIGVFWSDQNRDEFGFCIHHDGDAASAWQPLEVASSGAGHADDHVHLAYDEAGRVYALTKDDFDRMTLHRRETDGSWTVKSDVTGGIGTRGIVMVSDADSRCYILWTDWTSSPDRIVYRSANLSSLQFGSSTTLIASGTGSMNNVTGTKQELPTACLMAAAEGASKVWWNGWGTPGTPQDPPPGPPQDLVATLLGPPARIELGWSPPASGTPDGYIVYRQLNGGSFTRLTPGLYTSTAFIDSALVGGTLGYKVTAFAHQQEGTASNVASVLYTPPPPAPPSPPLGLTATASEETLVNGRAAYLFDEGTGQTVTDATGLNHTGQLGTKPIADTSDPIWTMGVDGRALLFDGSNDHLRIADAPDLRFPASFTIEAWIQRSRTNGAECVLAKGDSGRRNFSLELDAANLVLFRWQTSAGKDHGMTSAYALTDLSWHHVACVYDQAHSEDRIYVDGVLVRRNADSGIPATSADPLFIGAKTTSGSIKTNFHGKIDLPRVAAGALYDADFVPAPGFPDAAPHTVIHLTWQAPASGTPAGYHVYRQAADSTFMRINPVLVTTLTWPDPNPPTATECYRVTAVDALGQEGAGSETACTPPAAGKASRQADLGTGDRALHLAVAPNPFNPTTTIRFRLATAGRVHAAVYDVRGRRVALLTDQVFEAGEHSLVWNAGTRVASGAYFLVLDSGSSREHRKLVLLE